MYRNGQIELAEQPTAAHEHTHVIVTFLDPVQIDLSARGMDAQQAADVRARLASFAEEWDSPEMNMYDTYDATQARV